MVLRIKSSSIQKRQLVLWFLVYKKPSNIFSDFSQFSRSVMSDSLQPHGLQHARLPCPSPSLREGSNSSPSSQWCHPTNSSSVVRFSSCIQSIPSSGSFQMSQIFAIRWPKYWSFSFSISLSNEYSGLFSFRTDWFDLAVQGTLKSLLNSSKASILWRSAFFIVQHSHPYMTIRKTIGCTIWTFVSKIMSLLFNMLSRLLIVFLPRSKRLLVHGCSYHLQWFWSPPKIKSVTVSTVSPSISHHFMGNRWGNSGNCVRLYFSGLCRWWLQPWN